MQAAAEVESSIKLKNIKTFQHLWISRWIFDDDDLLKKRIKIHSLWFRKCRVLWCGGKRFFLFMLPKSDYEITFFHIQPYQKIYICVGSSDELFVVYAIEKRLPNTFIETYRILLIYCFLFNSYIVDRLEMMVNSKHLHKMARFASNQNELKWSHASCFVFKKLEIACSFFKKLWTQTYVWKDWIFYYYDKVILYWGIYFSGRYKSRKIKK